MKLLLILVIAFLISISSFAQQGINYKALIKDSSGNVLVNTNNISVSKDAIIETVAEKILSQEKPANVVDASNNIIGSVKPSKIIQTVFRTGKEKS